MIFYQSEQSSDNFIHDKNHEQIILERHAAAKKMMNAMVACDEVSVNYYLRKSMDGVREIDRTYTPEEANPRQMQNRLISLNVTFSFCANAANVHPLYLHSISRRFEKKIEQVTSETQEAALMEEMIKSYCVVIRYTYTERFGEFSDSVVQLLLKSLVLPSSLEEIACELHVAPATVSRKFKAETGQTIPEFVNRSRIRLAQLYMQEANCNLSNIAHSIGFSDASYFSKVFLRYSGITPTEYLKNINTQTPFK